MVASNKTVTQNRFAKLNCLDEIASLSNCICKRNPLQTELLLIMVLLHFLKDTIFIEETSHK